MQLDRNLVIVDVETTGVDPETASVIQLGAVVFGRDGYLVDRSFMTYIQPYRQSWSIKAQKVHGFTREFLSENGQGVGSALGKFENWLKLKPEHECDSLYVGQWGCGFDTDCLRSAYEFIGIRYPFSYRSYDIASFVRLYLASQNMLDTDCKNGEVDCAKKLGIEADHKEAHDGLYDARLSGLMLQEVMQRCGS